MYPAPHGAICAALLAPVCELNWRRLSQLNGSASQLPLGRFDEIARLVTGNSAATAADGFRWIREQVSLAAIPGLGHWGIAPAAFDEISTKAAGAGSMKGNPLVLSSADLNALLAESL